MTESDKTDTPSGPDACPRWLVVGAGEAGRSLVEEIRRDRLPVEPVAFLDDKPELQASEVCGLPVIGGTDDVIEAVARVRADAVLLAIPSCGGRLIRKINILCKRAGAPLRIVPGLRDIIDGDVHFAQVSDIRPEHLLGRESVHFQVNRARGVVAGARVLVTGAGGSIGGELCRQLLSLEPAELILLGRGENSIFEINAELETRCGATRLTPVIADVRDAARLDVLADRLQPDLILHAAAHKHVPLMEDNPEEAILVNVGGTANLIAFARRVGAERFVLISTDKAVAPSNVMGASKKMAEMLVRKAARDNGATRLMVVRFGNVLGSRGSVVPFFQSRIAAGQPLPVTDTRMTRYFMTMREAALLVIEAMVMGESGANYVLEMGDPVSILELARNLLVLSGFDPGDDHGGPGIRITGLRPGERLEEALHEADETITASDHPLIKRAVKDDLDLEGLDQAVADLCALAVAGDRPGLRHRLAGFLSAPDLDSGPGAGA